MDYLFLASELTGIRCLEANRLAMGGGQKEVGLVVLDEANRKHAIPFRQATGNDSVGTNVLVAFQLGSLAHPFFFKYFG